MYLLQKITIIFKQVHFFAAGENANAGILGSAANNLAKGMNLVNRVRTMIRPTENSIPEAEKPNNSKINLNNH